MTTTLIIIIITILLSAFFSGMEIAFVSSNRLKIELDKNKGSLSALLLSRYTKSPSKFIASLLLGNNIALVVYGIAMAKILEPLIETALRSHSSEFLVLVIQTLIATFLILITAEFLPKVLFRINPNKILNFFTVPISIYYYLSYPIVYLFIEFSEFFLKKVLKIKFSDEKYILTPTDFDNYIKEFTKSANDVNLYEPEIQMLQNVIDFRNIKLRECLIPRNEIDALEENESIQVLKEKFIETKHSKILIYKDTIDNIIGYVHSFDLFKNPKSIKSFLKPILIAPETMLASNLMTMLIRQRKSVAVVVDEFGGTSGMLTLEDVIEEIFGEIEDEFDEEDLIEKQISDTEFILSGRHEIDYLNEKYKLDIEDSEDYETLAGFIIKAYESIPEVNDKIHIKSFLFTILDASDNKIEKVNLKIIDS
ncbi:MAG: hemolysin family protein [Saprospiraceae bacterium]|nr:hemolysin family protein [Saprospiraceae bacterium]